MTMTFSDKILCGLIAAVTIVAGLALIIFFAPNALALGVGLLAIGIGLLIIEYCLLYDTVIGGVLMLLGVLCMAISLFVFSRMRFMTF